jgi:hypothetical protein
MPELQYTVDLVFAQMIRKAVLASPHKMAHIARGAGVPQSSLWKFMNRESDLTVGSADKLGNYLGVAEPAEGSDKDAAEKLLALIDHYRTSGEFLDEQIPQ